MPLPTEFHPEFGYLVPSPQLRRVMLVALVAALGGALFGGAGVLALNARQDRAVAVDVPAVATAQIADAAMQPGAGFAPVADIVEPVAASAKPCAEQTWPYLDRKCVTGITSRFRHVRMLPPEMRSRAEPVKSADAANERATPPEPEATPTKKRKSASRRTRSRDNDELDGGNDYASTRDWREARRDRADGEDIRRQSRREARQDRRERDDFPRRERPDPTERHLDGGNWFFGR
jgi:hypothetical protein